MSKYTTGELAKRLGVSVRTVQYYDDRGILIPSELSEGGRRLYSEADVRRLEIICFLREMGISIGSIASLFAEEHPERVITLLIEEQEKALRADMAACEKKLSLLSDTAKALADLERFSVESIGDIARIMKQKDKLRRMRWIMILTGIPVTALQWAGILLWILQGIWWVFALWVPVALIYGILVSRYYFGNVSYICPECHTIFKPKFKEAFWAYHTPTMRKLTCTGCGHKGMCVEVITSKEEAR